MLAEGFSCGLHKIERLMRQQALRARPRRRGLPKDIGERRLAAVLPESMKMLGRINRALLAASVAAVAVGVILRKMF